jgi:predicted transcriptional regulator
MTYEALNKLSRREREIMEIIYRRGQATATEVYTDLGYNPTYSAVRSFLRILEEKGHLLHKKQGRQYLYYPSFPRENAVKSAIRDLLGTFFNNSTEQAVAALLEVERTRLTDADLDRMTALIEKARQEGR